MRNTFFWKIFFLIFGDWAKNYLLFDKKFFWRGCRNRVSREQRPTLRKNDFFVKKSTLLAFSHNGGKLSAIWQKLLGPVVKTLINVTIGTFWEGVIFSENFFYHFWRLSIKLSAFWRTFFDGVAKTAFYVYTGTFWWEIFFSEKFFNIIFGHWAKNSLLFDEKFLTGLS